MYSSSSSFFTVRRLRSVRMRWLRTALSSTSLRQKIESCAFSTPLSSRESSSSLPTISESRLLSAMMISHDSLRRGSVSSSASASA